MNASTIARRSAAGLWFVLAAVVALAGIAAASIGVVGALFLLVLAILGVLVAVGLLLSDSRRSALISGVAGVAVVGLAAEAWITTTSEAAAGNLAALIGALGIVLFSGISARLAHR